MCTSWLCDGTRYNPTIWLQLHGHSFGNFFNTEIKDRDDIMCAIDAYGDHHPPTEPENSTIGDGRPLKNNSPAQELESLGNTLNFIYQWLKWFGNNYYTRVIIYNNKIWDFSKQSPQSSSKKA